MSDDAKLASVLRCLSGQLKTQAMVHVSRPPRTPTSEGSSRDGRVVRQAGRTP